MEGAGGFSFYLQADSLEKGGFFNSLSFLLAVSWGVHESLVCQRWRSAIWEGGRPTHALEPDAACYIGLEDPQWLIEGLEKWQFTRSNKLF